MNRLSGYKNSIPISSFHFRIGTKEEGASGQCHLVKYLNDIEHLVPPLLWLYYDCITVGHTFQ